VLLGHRSKASTGNADSMARNYNAEIARLRPDQEKAKRRLSKAKSGGIWVLVVLVLQLWDPLLLLGLAYWMYKRATTVDYHYELYCQPSELVELLNTLSFFGFIPMFMFGGFLLLLRLANEKKMVKRIEDRLNRKSAQRQEEVNSIESSIQAIAYERDTPARLAAEREAEERDRQRRQQQEIDERTAKAKATAEKLRQKRKDLD
jgi:hypothetical protein